MTRVYLAPWLVVMGVGSFFADWLAGVETDHPEFLLFLGVVFAIYDGMKWLWSRFRALNTTEGK